MRTALVFCGILFMSSAIARAESVHVAKLNTYTLQLFQAEAKLKESQTFLAKQIDSAYVLLEASTKDAILDPEPSLLKAIFELASRMIQDDPSHSAAELIEPLMKRHTSACDKVIKAVLSPDDAAELRQAVKDVQREIDEGNG